jgi:hypothetical protein
MIDKKDPLEGRPDLWSELDADVAVASCWSAEQNRPLLSASVRKDTAEPKNIKATMGYRQKDGIFMLISLF